MRAIARFLVLGLGVAALGCAEPVEPPDLIGVWRTDAEPYRDRSFEVQDAWIVFGTGGHGSASHPREGTECVAQGEGSLLCTLYYRTPDGSRTRLRLVYEAGPPESVRFENRGQVWLREPDARRVGQRG